jgi:hypothetical protein
MPKLKLHTDDSLGSFIQIRAEIVSPSPGFVTLLKYF